MRPSALLFNHGRQKKLTSIKPFELRSTSAITVAGACIAAAFAGTKIISARSRRASLRGKMVLITGGSRGLGLALAREFGKYGAQLALCARDKEELEPSLRDSQLRTDQRDSFCC
jgi:NADPH:quinone reductase-like Zn-dependent oxidoreductase